MAHFREKRIMKRKRLFFERISRIPYNEESFERYKISPSANALEDDLIEFLNTALNQKKYCFDGQNGNMLDNYIESWENLAKARLKTQKTERDNKIANLSNIRKAVRKNAEDWLKIEREELKKIDEEIIELERKHKEFLTRTMP